MNLELPLRLIKSQYKGEVIIKNGYLSKTNTVPDLSIAVVSPDQQYLIQQKVLFVFICEREVRYV